MNGKQHISVFLFVCQYIRTFKSKKHRQLNNSSCPQQHQLD